MAGGLHVKKRMNVASFKNGGHKPEARTHFLQECTKCGAFVKKTTLRFCDRCYSRWRYRNHPGQRENDLRRSEYHNDLRKVERIIQKGKVVTEKDKIFERGFNMGFMFGYGAAKKRFVGDKKWHLEN